MKNTFTGLYIGSTSMKVTWLDVDKKNIKYLVSESAPVLSKGMSSESPIDHKEIAKEINKLVIGAKITTNNVSIALPENRVYTKVIDMPNLSEKELSNAIYWEAEQHIPAPLDTMSLDWSILRKPKNNDPTIKMQVMIVAAPLQLIKRYQTVLELAGLTIISIETQVLSVARSIVASENFPTSIILNIGALTTALSIVQNGIILFTYLIPLGGVAMTRVIAADFGLALPQAEEYKKTYGLTSDNFGGKIRGALEPILSSIVAEIKKASAYYSEKNKIGSSISQLILTGASAQLPGINTYFAQKLGMETIIGNPWKMLNIQGVPEAMMHRGPEFAISIGLALKEL